MYVGGFAPGHEGVVHVEQDDGIEDVRGVVVQETEHVERVAHEVELAHAGHDVLKPEVGGVGAAVDVADNLGNVELLPTASCEEQGVVGPLHVDGFASFFSFALEKHSLDVSGAD